MSRRRKSKPIGLNKWTKEMLILYGGTVWTMPEMVEWLGHNEATVRIYLHMIGREPLDYKSLCVLRHDCDDDFLRSLLEQWELPNKQLAEELNVSPRTLTNTMRRVGIFKYATHFARVVAHSPTPDIFVRGHAKKCQPCSHFQGRTIGAVA